MAMALRVEIPLHEHMPAVELCLKLQAIAARKRIIRRPQGILRKTVFAIILAQEKRPTFELN